MTVSQYGILLASDSSQLRDGLAVTFSTSGMFEIIGVVDLQHLLATAENLQPEVVLCELNKDWNQTLKRLKACCPLSVIVVMVNNPNHFDVSELINCGAMGYLPLRLLPQQIVKAVELIVGAGLLCLPRPNHRMVASGDRDKSVEMISALSPREKEILELLGHKLSAQEIAASLYVSEATVKTHLRNIYRKLSVRNRGEAVAVAYQLGLVRDSK